LTGNIKSKNKSLPFHDRENRIRLPLCREWTFPRAQNKTDDEGSANENIIGSGKSAGQPTAIPERRERGVRWAYSAVQRLGSVRGLAHSCAHACQSRAGSEGRGRSRVVLPEKRPRHDTQGGLAPERQYPR